MNAAIGVSLVIVVALATGFTFGLVWARTDAKDSIWRRRTDDARRIKGDPPPTYAQLEATVDTLTVLTRQQGGIIRNLRSQVDSLMVENAQLRAAELGVVAAESKPGGGKLDREMPRLELDPSPTRLYVLPDYGIDHRKDEQR